MHRVIIATVALYMLTAGSLQARDFHDIQLPDQVTQSSGVTPL